VDNTFFEDWLDKEEELGMVSNLGATLLSISVGASMGAILRWWLGTQLNSLFPTLPAVASAHRDGLFGWSHHVLYVLGRSGHLAATRPPDVGLRGDCHTCGRVAGDDFAWDWDGGDVVTLIFAADLFTNTKLRKNLAQQIIGGEFACNAGEIIECEA
jgi:hypothetical protein